MRSIRTTARFDRRLVMFVRHHPGLKEVVKSVMKRIAAGSAAAGLQVHALHGSLRGYHAARVSQSYRLVFALELDVVTFIDIGSHDEVY